jgi:hypothetical protein
MDQHDQNREQEARPASSGATLPGDRARGAGTHWRGRLDDLREKRKQRRRGLRLREPLIGLTMVGAAVPMANAVKKAAPEGRLPERSVDPSMQTVGGDVEDAVGQRWAQARAQNAREDTVTSAMERFDIDRALAESIYDIAEQEGIDVDVAYGLVRTESTFRPRAVS